MAQPKSYLQALPTDVEKLVQQYVDSNIRLSTLHETVKELDLVFRTPITQNAIFLLLENNNLRCKLLIRRNQYDALFPKKEGEEFVRALQMRERVGLYISEHLKLKYKPETAEITFVVDPRRRPMKSTVQLSERYIDEVIRWVNDFCSTR